MMPEEYGWSGQTTMPSFATSVVGGWSNVNSIDREQHPGIHCLHRWPCNI